MMKITKLAKRIFAWFLPEKVHALISAVRGRRMIHRLQKQWGVPALNRKLILHFGNRCIGGVFPGLILPSFIQAEQIGPFLLGTYEKEITPWFDEVRTADFLQVVDVGAKFGFYAVGLAKWFPNSEVLAFDTDPWARGVTKRFAQANNVNNVKCCGFCSPEWLAINLRPNSLLICDCEGYEFTLLDPLKVPNLATATMIVESHDAAPWSKHLELIGRFQATHYVSEQSFDPSFRMEQSRLDLTFLNDQERALAVCETRNHWQKWIFFRPKNVLP